MRYLKVKILRKNNSGQDELGNDLNVLEVQGRATEGRFTPWNKKDLDLVGRSVIESSRKMILETSDKRTVHINDCIEIDGEVYEVTKVIDYNRWLCIYVRNFKND